MAGYWDTKKLIEDTLVGRPVGTLILPEGHQNFALSLLDYIRSIELLGSSVLQGIAQQDTVPIQPNDSKVSYVGVVPAGQTYTFSNFHDENGDIITITSNSESVSFCIFIWNCIYWSVQVIPIAFSSGGKYYGFYPSSSDLPSGTDPGYAYVGQTAPFSIYNFDGNHWSDSGSTINGINGEPGVGFDSVTTQQDGTVDIHLTNGNVITIDLNHEHPQYMKHVECESQLAYDSIATKDAGTVYTIGSAPSKIYIGSALIYQGI